MAMHMFIGQCPVHLISYVVNVVSQRSMYFIGVSRRDASEVDAGRKFLHIVSCPTDALVAAALSPSIPHYDDPAVLTSLLPWNTSYASIPRLNGFDGCAVWRNRIVLTGQTYSADVDTRACQYYDTITNEYKVMASRPFETSMSRRPHMTVYNNQLYIWSRMYRRVWRYNEENDIWVTVSALTFSDRYIVALMPTSYGLLVCAQKAVPLVFMITASRCIALRRVACICDGITPI